VISFTSSAPRVGKLSATHRHHGPLPLSLIGVTLAQLVARSTPNIFSMIGFVMLMGLMTRSAILLPTS
jgi:hypothetical protein